MLVIVRHMSCRLQVSDGRSSGAPVPRVHPFHNYNPHTSFTLHPQSDSYEPSYRFILAITRVRVVPSTRYRQSDGNQHGWLSAPNYTDRTTSSPLSHNLDGVTPEGHSWQSLAGRVTLLLHSKLGVKTIMNPPCRHSISIYES